MPMSARSPVPLVPLPGDLVREAEALRDRLDAAGYVNAAYMLECAAIELRAREREQQRRADMQLWAEEEQPRFSPPRSS